MRRKNNIIEMVTSGGMLIITILLILVGCADQTAEEKEVSGVMYPAFFSRRDIVVPVRVTSSYIPSSDFVQFGSKSSFEQIGESILKWDPEAIVEVYGRSMFISSKNQETEKMIITISMNMNLQPDINDMYLAISCIFMLIMSIPFS